MCVPPREARGVWARASAFHVAGPTTPVRACRWIFWNA